MSLYTKATLPQAQTAFFQSLVEQGDEMTALQAECFEARPDVQTRRANRRNSEGIEAERVSFLARDLLKFSSAHFEVTSRAGRELTGAYHSIMLHPPSWGAGEENDGQGRPLTIDEQITWVRTALETATQAARVFDSGFFPITYLHLPEQGQRYFQCHNFDNDAGFMNDPLTPQLRLDHLAAAYRPKVGVQIDFRTENYILPIPAPLQLPSEPRTPPTGQRTPDRAHSPTIATGADSPGQALRRRRPPSPLTHSSPLRARPVMVNAATSPHTKLLVRKPRKLTKELKALLASPAKTRTGTIQFTGLSNARTPASSQVKRALFKSSSCNRKFELSLYQLLLTIFGSLLAGFVLASSLQEEKPS